MSAPEVEFIASRLAGGSEHSFEPGPGSKWFGMGSIVFHKPHPEDDIDAVELACWGKRMGKWFGWGEGSFELKKGGPGGGGD